MTDKRAAGDHLGYVAYHIEAISRRDEELEDEIKEIRKEFGGEWDRIREDRKALKRFRHDIQKRLKNSKSRPRTLYRRRS